MANQRIPEMPPMASLPSGGLVPVYNPITGLTEKFDLSTLATSSSADARWVSTFSYSEGEIVTYDGKIWESIVPGSNSNTGNVPIEGAGFWTERSKSQSGLTMYVPGVFTETEVFVLNNLDGYIQLYNLASATRPYNSTDFNLEFAQGDWVLASERGYMPVGKAAHGFILNDVLTFKSGNWNKFTTGDKQLAIVRQVIDSDRVIVFLTGNRIKNLVGLTPNSIYYAQADATISTVISSTPLFLAISTTEAIQLNSSSGGGGADLSRRNFYRFQSNLFTEQALSYRGLISSLSTYLTNQLTSVTFEVRLDSSSTWTTIADLTALQTWINSNITGTEASGTLYWIKVLATYTSSGTGEAEVRLSYTAS